MDLGCTVYWGAWGWGVLRMGVKVHGFGMCCVLGYMGNAGWGAQCIELHRVGVYSVLGDTGMGCTVCHCAWYTGVCCVGVHRDIGVCGVRVCFGLRCTVKQGWRETECIGLGSVVYWG